MNMKAVLINGSPRKNWNTHKLLLSAEEGLNDAGVEVAIKPSEIVELLKKVI